MKAEWQLIDKDIQEWSLFFSPLEGFSGLLSTFFHYPYANILTASWQFQCI